MIYSETKLKIIDNSGGKLAKCIKILNSSNVCGAKAGSVIIVSIKNAAFNKSVKKGGVYKALFVRGKKFTKRNYGLNIKFNENAVILLNDNYVPISSKIYGPIYKELKENNYSKLISISNIML